ncbi:MAG: L-arabinose isomerase [Bacteroidetes bacterium]|nr:L-arabinose isomerase [Bacteroidota bacterium]
MKVYKEKEVWFVTGSQHLYGAETLKKVAADSEVIARSLNEAGNIPVTVVFKPVLTTPDAIYKLCTEANVERSCVGLITWMHTFSPAKMWIRGLKSLEKPFLHFHTQFNQDIPWDTIDMDFMNLNQSAHGGREFGYICSRLRIDRKVVVGHWHDTDAVGKIAIWTRAAVAFDESRNLKIARFGDNMRDVAVTEGDKVSAQIKMNYSVYGYGVGDLVKEVNNTGDAEINKLIIAYGEQYSISKSDLGSDSIREAARIEAGMRSFLDKGGFKAFTTTFEDLHGLKQLPGLAVQRLMEDGYGFGAEGDWKTSALVRIMKVMAKGLPGGTSFMEDYTYHLDPKGMKVLGAHMLEVCPSVAAARPTLEIHPLSIGSKADPARLVFKSASGKGVNVSVMDMGNRFRMVVNTLEVVDCPEMKKLPVARVLWKPLPDLKTAAHAWILAGGAHHTGFSMAIGKDYIADYAAMAGIEMLVIDENTCIEKFREQIRWNELYYHLANGII